MAQLQWQDVNAQSNVMGDIASQFMQTAKETAQRIGQGLNPFDVSNNYVTPQEYFSKDWADNFMNQQTEMWNRFNQQQEEFNQEKQNFFNQREQWLNEKEELINQISSNNPAVGDYRSAQEPITNSGSTSSGSKQMNEGQQAFYSTFRNNGLSHNQAMAIMANINAENSWRDSLVYGNHQDGKRRAYGALSWQGGREVALLKQLQDSGLYNPNTGKIVNNAQSAKIQAEYILSEMRGSQSGSLGNWMKQGDASFGKLAQDFSDRFVRPSRKAHIQQARREAYNSFYSMYGSNPTQGVNEKGTYTNRNPAGTATVPYKMDTSYDPYKGVTQKAQRASEFALANAGAKSTANCALYVNNALRAQGISIYGHGKDVANNLLKRKDFQQIQYSKDYQPMIGDVMSLPSSSNPQYGHVAIYTKNGWVSDFKQKNSYGNTGTTSQAVWNNIQSGKAVPIIARHIAI